MPALCCRILVIRGEIKPYRSFLSLQNVNRQSSQNKALPYNGTKNTIKWERKFHSSYKEPQKQLGPSEEYITYGKKMSKMYRESYLKKERPLKNTKDGKKLFLAPYSVTPF